MKDVDMNTILTISSFDGFYTFQINKVVIYKVDQFYKHLVLIDNMQINGNHKFMIKEELRKLIHKNS